MPVAEMTEAGLRTIAMNSCAWQRAATCGLAFRPMSDADLPFMRRVYASTRQEELAPLPWSEQQKSEFVDMQFRAQHEHYKTHYGDMDWLVILHDGTPAGRLYIRRDDDTHSIVDIAFLPEFRRRGLGTALLLDLLDEAAAQDKSMTIYVEKFNPAMRLYLRLGFTRSEDHGVYDLMQWRAAA